jgi:hypothetical protein
MKQGPAVLVIVSYFLAMALCMHKAFGFENSHVGWYFAILGLTFPWSTLLVALMIWTHGTGLGWTWAYWSFAILNSATFYWLAYLRRRRRTIPLP